MKKILTVFMILLAVLMVIVLVSAGAFLIKWIDCAQTKSVPEVVEIIFRDQEIRIGDKVNCTFKVKTSWSLMPVSTTITPSEGIQEGDAVKITPDAWQWGTRTWDVTVQIQPFRNGSYSGIPVRILCEGGPDGKAEIKTQIPDFKVSLPEISDETKLDIAEQVQEDAETAKGKRHWHWYLSGVGVILLTLLLWLFFLFKKRKRSVPVPPWRTALEEISSLRKTLYQQEISTETAVIRLTDIVRHFMEKQYSLRAERQTTDEFLETLRRDQGILNVEQHHFLRDFLSSADMIKFARLEADHALFDDAAERAESLIRSAALEAEQKEKLS